MTNVTKLCPREPTPEMSAAGFSVPEAEHDPAGVWRAMYDAAPAEAAQGEDNLRFILERIIADLPTKRDWLDPALEQIARRALAPKAPAEAAQGEVAAALQAAIHALRSYQYGNSSDELAEEVADRCERALAPKAAQDTVAASELLAIADAMRSPSPTPDDEALIKRLEANIAIGRDGRLMLTDEHVRTMREAAAMLRALAPKAAQDNDAPTGSHR